MPEDENDVDSGEDAWGLVVSTVRQEYHLRASSVEERNNWLAALRAAQHRAIKVGKRRVRCIDGTAEKLTGYVASRRNRWGTHLRVLKMPLPTRRE